MLIKLKEPPALAREGPTGQISRRNTTQGYEIKEKTKELVYLSLNSHANQVKSDILTRTKLSAHNDFVCFDYCCRPFNTKFLVSSI